MRTSVLHLLSRVCLIPAWLCVALFCASASAQTTWFVDGSVTTSGAGTGWGSPFKFLSTALTNPLLVSGDTIWLRGNQTYYPDESIANPSGSGDVTASFIIPEPIRLIGGFAGTEEFEIERGNPFLRPTVLSADLAGNDDYTA